MKLTFSISEGESFGFLGPSGAGKTTTQKILIGLLKDYQGEVTVLDQDLKTWKPKNYYEKIGVSFELPNQYLKLTARENLELFRSFYTSETEDPMALLELVGLEKDSELRVSQFSKGMKGRLNFARSPIHRPQLLFFDEPTMGLDPVNAQRIKDIILERKEAG
ncbi:MAG: ATP-binding cassette domain-containing protein [Promethearchaeota archaeon]